MPAPVPTYHVQRLTTAQYETPSTLAAQLQAIANAGGKIEQIVSCSSIRSQGISGYFWIDVIYTT
jgi:hypothetical protein